VPINQTFVLANSNKNLIIFFLN